MEEKEEMKKTKSKPRVKESVIQKQILDYLRYNKFQCWKHRSVGIFRKDTKHFIPVPIGEKGISDIIGIMNNGTGRLLACEVKAKGGKPTPEQTAFLDKVNKAGGIGILAYSLDDVINGLKGE